MKIRTGFVSNSSSSSFIIGIAKINNVDKLREYLKENKINSNYLRIISKDDLTNNTPYNVSIKSEKSVELESFTYSSVRVDIGEMTPFDMVLLYEYHGHDDSDFWDEGYGEYEYDIDLDFFDNSEISTVKMFNDPNSGLDVSSSETAYGAGRNG